MDYLIKLTDKDVFPEGADSSPLPFLHEDNRKCARVIVFDKDNKIALVGTRYFVLPGGGVEIGESYEEAAVRECREEIGCTVSLKKEIGYVHEYRARIDRRQETCCFIARVVGEKGTPESTQEDEQGMEVRWLALEDALKLLAEQAPTIPQSRYNTHFNVMISKFLLLECKRVIDQELI